jgi:general secretion pathway protein F
MTQSRPKPLTYQVRADLFNSLAAMEKAGLPVDRAVGALRVPGAGRARVEKLRAWLVRGADMATAGEKSGLFTPLEVSFVRAALNAGSPAATYRRLADQYTHQARQIAAAKSRLYLPLVVLTLALLLQPLPELFAGTLGAGGYVLRVLRPLVALLALLLLARRLKSWYGQSPTTPMQAWAAHRLTRLPVFGKMHLRANNRDFFSNLALLLEAGIPMFDALPKAVDTIGNCVVRADFARVKKQMVQGDTLARAAKSLRYIGNSQVIGYIETGEASGTLPEMLARFVRTETDVITHFQQQVATWLPRAAYGLVMLWMAYQLLTGSAFMPHVPEELR